MRMLVGRRPTLAAIASVTAPAKAPQKSQSTMAQATTRTIWVKGDPNKQELGDCPFCHRSLLTLELKGLPYSKEFVDFSDKPQWIQDLGGKVPVMKDGEKIVPDSGDICEYLTQEYPQPELGKCKLEGVAEGLFPSAFLNYLKAKKENDQNEEQELEKQLQEIEDFLGKTGPYLGGQEMQAYDAMIFPRLYHLTVAADHFKGWSMPDKFGNVKAYIDRVKQTQAFKNTYYGPDKIIGGWKPKVEG